MQRFKTEISGAREERTMIEIELLREALGFNSFFSLCLVSMQ